MHEPWILLAQHNRVVYVSHLVFHSTIWCVLLITQKPLPKLHQKLSLHWNIWYLVFETLIGWDMANFTLKAYSLANPRMNGGLLQGLIVTMTTFPNKANQDFKWERKALQHLIIHVSLNIEASEIRLLNMEDSNFHKRNTSLDKFSNAIKSINTNTTFEVYLY